MNQGVFVSSNPSASTTFHLLADNTTTYALIASIASNCTTYLASTSTLTMPVGLDQNAPGAPQPEQAVQYYRASSVVLTLDGYNNTGAFSDDDNTPDTPLPTTIDLNLLNCLNQTIGLNVPLVDGATTPWAGGGLGMMGLFWMVWFLAGLV